MRADLYLLRHGETTGESSIRLNGVTDVPLSGLGRRQMGRARERLADISFDRVVASPLSRSVEGASIVADREAGALTILREFIEIDFGEWETLTFAEVGERDPEGLERWRTEGEAFAFPGGESRGGFRRRVASAARAHLAGFEGATLAVLHKGIIKIVWSTLLDEPLADAMAMPVDLGALFHLTREGERWRAVARNDVSHLGDAHLADDPHPKR